LQLLYCSKLSPKKQELVLLSHQFQDIIHFSHNTEIVFPSVGDKAVGAILDAVVRIDKVATALVP
jgi:hypothetical protein